MPFDLHAHLVPLQVVVPLMAAPFAIIMRRPILVWAWATLITVLVAIMAVTLLGTVLTSGPISYAVGNWAPPWGIELHVDLLSAIVLLLVSGIALITVIYGRVSILAEIQHGHIYLYYICFLLCLTGLLGITVTGDAFNLYVFLEIMSLSSYAMISLGKSRRALTAAYNYLILGTIGATFYVIGIGLIFMLTGTLNMADIAHHLASTPVNRTEVAAVGFLLVGVALKLALFPLHKWLPNAYTYAPSAVTTFLASTATKVALYILIRIFLSVVDTAPLVADHTWAEMLIPFAVLGMFSASAVAMFQNNVKKMLAYSSVAQIGYMALGIGMATTTGVTAGILHMMNHAMIKATLFMAVGCVMLRLGSVRLEDWRGLGRQMPVTMFGFVLGGLSLIGVPLTTGFVSKWYLMLAAFDKGWWPLAVVVVLSSLLAVVYIWRVIETAYLRPRLPGAPLVSEAPLSMLIPLYVMVAANIYFGLDTTYTVGLAHAAAEALVHTAEPATAALQGVVQ